MEHTQNNQNPKKKNSWVKILLIVLACILLLAVLAVTIAGIFLGRWLNLINKTDGTVSTMSSSEMEEFLQNNTDAFDPDFTGEVLDAADVTWDTEPEVIDEGPNVINILLIGSDTRQEGVRARSDTMVLCTLNKSAKTLTLTSIMRDMYVQIPGCADNRINVPYAIGGMELLNKTLEKNFGVKVDGNFAVEFDSFKDVIDLIGGISINLTKEEVDYMNSSKWNNYANTDQVGRVYVVGENHLNGAEALGYSRNRTIGLSDFSRTERQRNVLTAIFNKCKNLSVAQLYKLMEQILPMLTTNMDNGTILSYAAQAAPLVSGLTLQTQRIPVDGGYRSAWVNGMAVLMPDLGVNRQVLLEILTDETPE